MRLTFFLFLSFQILVSSISEAQNSISWAKSYQGEAVNYETIIDDDGSIYSQGRWLGTDTLDFEPGTGNNIYTGLSFSKSYYITKHDAQGNFQWVVFLSNWMFMNFVENKIFLSNSVDRLIFTDPTGVSTTINNTGFQSYMYLIIDKNGSIFFHDYFLTDARTFFVFQGEKGADEETIYSGIFEDTVSFGFFHTIIGTNSWTTNFIMRQDKFGVFKMAKALDFGAAALDFPLNLSSDSEKNIYYSIAFSGNIDIDPGPNVNNISSDGNLNLMILKYDSMGDYLQHWHLKSQFGTADVIAFDQSGNFFIAGDFKDSINLSLTGPAFWVSQTNTHDNFLAAYDQNGDLQWYRNLSGRIEFNKGLFRENGEIFISGSFSQTINLDPGNSNFSLTSNPNFSSTPQDDFLVRYNSDGSFLGVQKFSAFEENLYDFIVDDNGLIYLNGEFYGVMFSPSVGLSSPYIPLMNCCSSPFLMKMNELSVNLNPDYNLELIDLYPNPSNGIYNIRFDNLKKSINFKLIDLTGKIILDGEFNSSNNILDLSFLTKGIYFLIAETEDRLYRKKLVLN